MADAGGRVKLLAYYPAIEAAAAAREGVAGAWARVRAAAEAEGITFTGATIQQMNAAYSRAAGNRNAAATFNAAAHDAQLGPEHIGQIPNATPFGAIGESRRYVVNFEHRVLRSGVETTVHRSDVFDFGLPPTKSSLLNRINRDAAILAEEYEDEVHVGIGDVRILAA